MNYRALGNTGLLVGEIGMGCEGLAGGEEHIREMFAAARAMGVNYRHDGFVYDIVQKGPLLGISGRF